MATILSKTKQDGGTIRILILQWSEHESDSLQQFTTQVPWIATTRSDQASSKGLLVPQISYLQACVEWCCSTNWYTIRLREIGHSPARKFHSKTHCFWSSQWGVLFRYSTWHAHKPYLLLPDQIKKMDIWLGLRDLQAIMEAQAFHFIVKHCFFDLL